MADDKLTVIVDPSQEPRGYPAWEFDLSQSRAKRRDKHDKWCWTASTTGLSTDLQNKFDTFKIKDLCRLIAVSPAYFFYGVDRDHIIWDYTYKHNEGSPSFSGADTLGNIHIAEIQWHNSQNIYEKIKKVVNGHIKSYAESKLGYGSLCNRKLIFYVAFPGRISSQHITALVSSEGSLIKQSPESWQEVCMRFGFIQLGWRAENPEAHLLRVYWFDGKDWDSTLQDFRSRNAHLVPLSLYT